MPRASTRISIRWPPAPASEPTDTLVLSVGEYYVDLRVRKDDGSIEWALAGLRIVISQDPGMYGVLFNWTGRSMMISPIVFEYLLLSMAEKDPKRHNDIHAENLKNAEGQPASPDPFKPSRSRSLNSIFRPSS